LNDGLYAYHFEEAIQEAAKFRVPIDFGDVVRLLSVAVRKLAGVIGVWQIDEFSTEFFEAEFGCKMDQRWQLELFVHCTCITDDKTISFQYYCYYYYLR